MWHTYKILIIAYVKPIWHRYIMTPPLVKIWETPRRSRAALDNGPPKHDDQGEQHSSSYIILATESIPPWPNHMILLPSYNCPISAYTIKAHQHRAPSPNKRRCAGPISQPQNLTQAIYFHVSFTQHTIQPPRSNTTNTRNIDCFRRTVHHVSNIELR